jgi:dolichol-phosphate mannosyltransferase
MSVSWALVVPMANEEKEFKPFIDALKNSLAKNPDGIVYLIVDNVSKDKTLELCKELSTADKRFITVWAPENKNVVDAYIRGYREALKSAAEYIIEMDAGLSHDPASLENFLKHLKEGIPCVYGSRFIPGGSMGDSPANRLWLSRGGTLLANFILGTRLKDMTSGYQGFHRNVAALFANYPLKSKAHFYQTEIRYLLRKHTFIELPIHYKSPSPSVSKKAIANSISSLFFYGWRRLTLRPISL